ncbi:MAG: serine/threonine protein kinase, partial [Steroidobacteraceae bacterium]
SHPHLIRLFEAGRCLLGGHQFLFVVMDYAEETLAEILPNRALTPGEVRDMLLPTLDALAFLHRQGLVQGQLKPPNFLVVNDQLKLAGDTVHPAGEFSAGIARSSPYYPPEAKSGRLSAAGDIWGLGMTAIEALTQRLPAWRGERSETVSLPATVPAEFLDTVRRCLNRNPADRPTAADLAARITRVPPAPAVSAPEPVGREARGRPTPAQLSRRLRPWVPAIAVGVIVLISAWTGRHLLASHLNSRQIVSGTPQISSPEAAAPAAASQNPRTSASTPASVLHQETPTVPRSARESIRGHIKVTVRVTVDRSGNVVGETLQTAGSSRYFARLASAAARKWKFAPADSRRPRVWLLRFEFTRGGTTARAAAATPNPRSASF